ncbi:DUF7344 domain-containing protein [Natronorubrum aibiense]|uniref:DUF7344 domain-containing protein n=1 Tax=Natronorubrum aibiense TaxID=348826 RepID=A0A5P9P4G9_9EURY|nr:hypothetical protein [Natronorubrum aibiense]QFU83051.1 hypothetical protein GCU68_11140 [Natronorubrum aibiense]
MKSTHISSEQQDEADTGGETECAAEEPTFSKDEIFHLLQNERRRLVLRYLRDKEGPVRMRDIAEQVAAWEHDTTVEKLTSTQRQRVYIPLYQSHLSKLDEAGIIDYQQNRGIVVRKPLADQVDQYLQIEPSAEQPDDQSSDTDWDDYYISATVLCYVVLIGAVIELPFLSLLSGIALSASILLLFTVLTISRLLN